MAKASETSGKKIAREKKWNETRMMMRQPVMLITVLLTIVLLLFICDLSVGQGSALRPDE